MPYTRAGVAQGTFSPDSATLVAVGSDGTVEFWGTGADNLVDHACSGVSRPLGEAEWKAYVTHLEYAPPCPR